MSDYDFTLALTGISALDPAMEEALFQAGCDDATLSVRSGRVYLAVTRTAASLKEAVLSAIGNVRSAGIGADVLRVDESNLVSQADIARKCGRSRQQIHQYINGLRGPGGFPPPLCDLSDGKPLWSWCEVARWLWENGLIQEDIYRQAEELEVINSVLELNYNQHRTPGLTEEVIRAVGT